MKILHDKFKFLRILIRNQDFYQIQSIEEIGRITIRARGNHGGDNIGYGNDHGFKTGQNLFVFLVILILTSSLERTEEVMMLDDLQVRRA